MPRTKTLKEREESSPSTVSKIARQKVKADIEKTESPKKRAGEHTKRRKKQDRTNYSKWLHRVLKQVHPEATITNKGMEVMNCFVKDMLDRIGRQAAILSQSDKKKKSIQVRGVLSALKLIVPGQLGAHACNEATRALNSYAEVLEASGKGPKRKASGDKRSHKAKQ